MDTPVRGLVYEAARQRWSALLERGRADRARGVARRWRIRAEVVSADPALHEAWLEAMKEAVERTLSAFARNAASTHARR